MLSLKAILAYPVGRYMLSKWQMVNDLKCTPKTIKVFLVYSSETLQEGFSSQVHGSQRDQGVLPYSKVCMIVLRIVAMFR